MKYNPSGDIVLATAKNARRRLSWVRVGSSVATLVVGMAAAWMGAFGLAGLGLEGFWGILAWMPVFGGCYAVVLLWHELNLPGPAGALLISGHNLAAQERFLTGLNLQPVIGVSPELVTLAKKRFVSTEFTLDLPLQYRRRLHATFPLATSAVVIAVILSIIASPLVPNATNLLLLQSKPQAQTSYNLTVSPGNAEVLKGSNFIVDVSISPPPPPGELPLLKWGAESADNSRNMTRNEDHFSITVPNIEQPFHYQVSFLSSSSPQYTVDVLAKPLIKTRQLRVQLPGYLGGSTITYPKGQADVAAPKGSMIFITVTTIPPAISASLHLQSSNNKEIPLIMNEGVWQGKINLEEDAAYQIVWEAEGQLYNEDEWHHLNVQADIAPTVWALEPGRDITINSQQTLHVSGAARDDHMVQSLALVLIHPLTGESVRISLSGGSQQVNGFYDWDLTRADLLPGEYLEYYFEAYDNDTVSGPKRAISATYRVRMPELDEIVETASKDIQSKAINLEEINAKSEELRKQLEVASQMSRNATSPEAINAGNREAKEILAQQQNLMKRLGETTSELKKNLDRISESQYMSPELAEKVAEVRRLTQELMTPEMRQTLEKLQKQLESLDPELVQKALEQMKNFSDQMSEDLDRTLELLKQVQIEQKLEELVRRAQQVAVKQTELNHAADNSKSPNQLNAEEQRDLQKALNNLLEDIATESQNLTSEDPNTAELLSQSEQNAVANQISEHMSRSALAMESGSQRQASEETSEAKNGVNQLSQELSNAAEARRMSQRNETLKVLNQALQELLSTSSEQSQIASDQSFNDTEQQDAISRGLAKTSAKLSTAAKRSFMVNPGMAKQAQEISRDAASSSSRGEGSTQNPGGSKTSPQSLLARINGLALQVLDAKASVMGSRSATGYSELLDSLKRLAGQQEKLGQQMGTEGNPIPDLLGMAAQQMGIRKGMEELADRYQSMEEATGNLGDIASQMRSLEEQLRSGSDASRIRSQQQEVYEKLLRAEKSVRTKGLSKRRKAEPAKFYPSAAPAGLPTGIESPHRSTGEVPGNSEALPASYMDWIEAYYQKLRIR